MKFPPNNIFDYSVFPFIIVTELAVVGDAVGILVKKVPVVVFIEQPRSRAMISPQLSKGHAVFTRFLTIHFAHLAGLNSVLKNDNVIDVVMAFVGNITVAGGIVVVTASAS